MKGDPHGERGRYRFLNCGTLLALLGLGVFALLAYILIQILCHGPGGAAPVPRYPG